MRALEAYEELSSKCDLLALLWAIHEIAFSLESQKYPAQQVYEMARAFLTLRQSPTQSTSDYLERFMDQVDLISFSQATITVKFCKKKSHRWTP